MAINLVDMAKGYLGRAVMDKIAGSLGVSSSHTESAIGAAIPSILGGLIGKAGTREGAEALSYELDKHDGGFLDNIGDAISGDGLGKLAGAGSGILGSLMGDSKLGGMLDLVGKVSGMGRSGSGSIIGLVGSLLMGILGKQKRSQGLDVGGIMGLLDSQKGHVAGGLPEGMGNILGLGDLGKWGVGALGAAGAGAAGLASGALSGVGNVASGVGGAVSGAAGSVGDAVSGTVGAVGDAGRAAGDAVGGAVSGTVGAVGDAGRATGDAIGGAVKGTAGAVGDAGRAVGGAVSDTGRAVGGAARDTGTAVKTGGGGIAKWLIPLLLLLGLGLLLMKLLGAKKPDINLPDVKAPNMEMPAGIAAPELGSINIPGLPAGMKDQVGGLFGDLGTTLGGVTDEASAKGALDGLTGLSGKLGSIASGATAETKGPLGKLVGMFLPQIQHQIDTVNNIPGVGAVLGPILKKIIGTVTGLAG